MAKAKRQAMDLFPEEIVVYGDQEFIYIAEDLNNLADGEKVATYKLKRKGKIQKTVGIAYNDTK